LTCEGAACVNLKEACDKASHKRVAYTLCSLGHSGHLHDRLSHFFQEWQDEFEKANLICVERQPFKSAGYPFELILKEKYGPKCSFVAPQTLHKHFRTGKLSYHDRKDATESRVARWLDDRGASSLWESICKESRQHDCADAILLLIHREETHGVSSLTKRKLQEETKSISMTDPMTKLTSPYFSSSNPSPSLKPSDPPTETKDFDFDSFLEACRYKPK